MDVVVGAGGEASTSEGDRMSAPVGAGDAGGDVGDAGVDNAAGVVEDGDDGGVRTAAGGETDVEEVFVATGGTGPSRHRRRAGSGTCSTWGVGVGVVAIVTGDEP